MSLFELFIIAVGLSMDAFAVSVCKGLALNDKKWRYALTIGLYFGGFQAGMPLLGYLLGTQFQTAITAYDHWIAFILLGIIGSNMLKEALSRNCGAEETTDLSVDGRTIILLAIATSIDALAIGVTFAFLQVTILPAVAFIGTITFTLSVAGVRAGSLLGRHGQSKAELAGGLILLLMAVKILASHLYS